MSEPVWRPNTTVAAVVERDGRFLMVEESTRDGLRWNQPAGHLDPGESLLQAVAREALEETGHSVTPRALVGVYMSRYHHPATATDVTYLRFAFACELVGFDAHRALDDGIVRAEWLTPAQINERASAHRSTLVVRTLDDYLSGRRYPLDLVYTDPNCLYRR